MKASSSLMVFVVIGDRSLSDCAVAAAKSASVSKLSRRNLLSRSCGFRRTQYMLHALVCGSLFDGLEWRHQAKRLFGVCACGGELWCYVRMRRMPGGDLNDGACRVLGEEVARERGRSDGLP